VCVKRFNDFKMVSFCPEFLRRKCSEKLAELRALNLQAVEVDDTSASFLYGEIKNEERKKKTRTFVVGSAMVYFTVSISNLTLCLPSGLRAQPSIIRVRCLARLDGVQCDHPLVQQCRGERRFHRGVYCRTRNTDIAHSFLLPSFAAVIF
jgi:hypothetical protein